MRTNTFLISAVILCTFNIVKAESNLLRIPPFIDDLEQKYFLKPLKSKQTQKNGWQSNYKIYYNLDNIKAHIKYITLSHGGAGHVYTQLKIDFSDREGQTPMNFIHDYSKYFVEDNPIRNINGPDLLKCIKSLITVKPPQVKTLYWLKTTEKDTETTYEPPSITKVYCGIGLSSAYVVFEQKFYTDEFWSSPAASLVK